MKWKITLLILAAFIVLSLPALQALTVGFDTDGDGQKVKAVLGVIAENFINRTDFWDTLDTPADILLGDLGDVFITLPTDGQVLTFESISGNWINADATGGGAGTNGTLNNTNIAYTNVTNVFTENQVIEGDLNVSMNITGNIHFGSMWQVDEALVPFTLLAVNQYANLTGLRSDYNNGFVFNGDNHSLTVLVPGIYKAAYSISIVSSGAGNTDFVTSLLIGGLEQNGTVVRRTHQTAGDFGSYSGVGVLSLAVDDVITMGIKDPSQPLRSGEYFSVSVELSRVGDN